MNSKNKKMKTTFVKMMYSVKIILLITSKYKIKAIQLVLIKIFRIIIKIEMMKTKICKEV